MDIDFLTNAFHFAITMNTKLMEELKNPPSFNKIMDEVFGMVNELTLLASNIKRGICVVGVLGGGGPDMQKETHNMLSLMLH
jgi:hypothetical protein